MTPLDRHHLQISQGRHLGLHREAPWAKAEGPSPVDTGGEDDDDEDNTNHAPEYQHAAGAEDLLAAEENA